MRIDVRFEPPRFLGRRGRRCLVVAVTAVATLAAPTMDSAATGGRFSSLLGARADAVQTGPLVALAADSGRIVSFPRVEGPADGFGGASVDAIVGDGHGGWFIGGSFDSVGGVECRGLAHVFSSHQVDSQWCPGLKPRSAFVTAIARRGNELFIGGFLTGVGDVQRAGMAALDARTGKDDGWNAPRLCAYGVRDRRFCKDNIETTFDGPDAIVIHGGAVYIAGGFLLANDKGRMFYAAFGLRSGKLLPWNPHSNNTSPRFSQRSLAATAHALFTAGDFSRIGGASRKGFAALSYVSARAQPLRLSKRACSAGYRNVMVVAQRRIYLSVLVIEHRVPNCRLAAFDAVSGRTIRWTPSLPHLNEYWDLPIAAFGRTVYSLREDFDTSSISLVRINTMSGAVINWKQPLFDDDVKAVAPADDGVVLVGGDFSEVG
jgi:hypothetical protein